jgi:alkylation response protein AidB-like acyl-CoA dehydrogenase
VPANNPLLSDRDVEFILYELHDAAALARLPAFADHDRETFDLFLGNARALARDVLFPAYRPMDSEPPVFQGGRITVHPVMKSIWPRMVELGVLTASRPTAVGGQQLPRTVAVLAEAYLMAGNLSAYCYAGLTTGAAHLIEAFGDDFLKDTFMRRMYAGEWTGTMALTEPHAGSSLADLRTAATPRDDGTYDVRGGKIFISGGDHDVTDNVVHLTLARIDGAPAGTRGISLFAIPRLRPDGDRLVDNDVSTAGMIHKIGWKGLPSLVINFGERGDCRGWLVGAPGHGLTNMFQMMNEARLMVGLNGIATASVAYHESLAYAKERRQGRPHGRRDPASPPVPIIEHADVRRMLLRQKAIVEGGLSLLVQAARLADLSEHAEDPAERRRSALLLDLLTPIAKSFAAERGFDSNALALQIFGGYGYSSEYMPEAWLRDQKLNSIHEGTTTIHGLDLLGRRALAPGALQTLGEEIFRTCSEAQTAGVDPRWIAALQAATETAGRLVAGLAAHGQAGDPERMLRHSHDVLDIFMTITVAWQWLRQATVASTALSRGTSAADDAFYRGKLQAAQYWLTTELARTDYLARLCRDEEDSYAATRPEWF